MTVPRGPAITVPKHVSIDTWAAVIAYARRFGEIEVRAFPGDDRFPGFRFLRRESGGQTFVCPLPIDWVEERPIARLKFENVCELLGLPKPPWPLIA